MLTSTFITFVVIYIVEATIIIVGNTFTIFVFWTQRSHLKRTYYLLINLAVADLFVGITELVVLGTVKFSEEKAIEGIRRSQTDPPSAFLLLFSSASVFFLALISLERAFAVLRPVRHRIANSRLYINSIVVVWAVGLCLFGIAVLSDKYPKVKREYVYVAIHTCLLISLLVICVSYFKIRNRLRTPSTEVDINNRQSGEHSLRLSRTAFIVIFASLVFWMPGFVVYLAREFCPRCFSSPVVWFVNAMHLANSMINPLVYSFRVQIFKDALKKLCRKRPQNIRPIQQNSLGLGLEGSFTPTI